MPIGTAFSVGLWGLKAYTIQVQAFTSSGLPFFSIIGLPDTSLAEARDRVKSACTICGFPWPQTRVTVNLSPASVPKSGSSFDLAIAASILASCQAIHTDVISKCLLIGELNLDGTVMPVKGILPMLLYAQRNDLHTVVIPQENLQEATLVPGLRVIGIRHIAELMMLLRPRSEMEETLIKRYGPLKDDGSTLAGLSVQLDNNHFQLHRELSEFSDSASCGFDNQQNLDFTQVIGQTFAKHALEVAAAGGHHMIMTGPPGAGKTMLARRLPTILPPLTKEERLEVASIKSVCGTLHGADLDFLPPFEAPHHTATVASLIGGGSGFAQPGSATRSHCGVLFMDEAPEFSTKCLQALREPLEEGIISLSRAKGTTFYPARFQLIMAANPCPCGFSWGSGKRCTCTPRQRSRYWGRLSGPIMDRIDIHIAVDTPKLIDIETTQEFFKKDAEGKTAYGNQTYSSTAMRDRVITARQRAARRFQKVRWSTNAQAPGQWMRENTPEKVLRLVRHAVEKEELSMRGADRTLRIAWTLADLEGHAEPTSTTMEEAIMLRTGDLT